MSVEARIRQLVVESAGRAPVERVVREALGVAGATGALARRLVQSALGDLRGLALDGDHVVERATPRMPRMAVLALSPVASSTALPATASWLALPAEGDPETVLLASSWREGVAGLVRDLAGCEIFALSAASARRVLRLGAVVAGLDPDDEPEVVALGPIARRLGAPLKGAEDAAALVGSVVPESPEDAARLLAKLCDELARRAGCDLAGLRELGETELPAEFDFGERAFGRAELRALPEAPGVYLLEDAEGDIAYIGKAQNLRRRVATYFTGDADERAVRVRDAAHGLSFERTGTELSALLREQQLIRELRPALNVAEQVHSRGRQPSGAGGQRLAVVMPSAEGGAEIVLLDRARGASACDVVPEAERGEIEAAVRALLEELARRPQAGPDAADVEIALTWLAERGSAASIVELPDDPGEACSLLASLARDPDLARGRIIPVR